MCCRLHEPPIPPPKSAQDSAPGLAGSLEDSAIPSQGMDSNLASGTTRGSATQSGGRLWTLANAVTLTRALAAPFLVAAVVTHSNGWAAALFALAVATDLVDGRLARLRGESSTLGGLLDHSTDALFCTMGLAALAWIGEVPALLPCLVAIAFLQYLADSRSIRGRPLRASSLGRRNGVLYFVMVGVPVVRDALGLTWPEVHLVRALGWALSISTLLSMADRAWALFGTRSSRSATVE